MALAGWMTIAPQLSVPDVAEAQRYYRDVFACKIAWLAEDGSFGAVYNGNNEIFFCRGEVLGQGVVCCVRVEDVESVYQSYRDAGADIISPLETKVWQMREFSVRDVYGYVFRIGQSTLMS